MKIYVLSTAVLLIQGCSIFTPPHEIPVIEEKLNSKFMTEAAVGTLSLTPDRRVVLVNFSSNRFCAEAPTEVGSDLSRVISANANADIPNEVKAKIGIAAAVASSNSVLNKRTQGMQLFLANSYFVCQMYMNQAINEEQLLKYQMEVFISAATLIEKELPLMYQVGVPPKHDGAKFKPFDADKLLKDLLELKDENESEPSSEAPPSPDPAEESNSPLTDQQQPH